MAVAAAEAALSVAVVVVKAVAAALSVAGVVAVAVAAGVMPAVRTLQCAAFARMRLPFRRCVPP